MCEIALYKGGVFMNSNSKYPMNVETANCRRNKDCGCKHPSGNKVIFRSNYGNLGPLDVTFTEGTPLQTFNLPIASVTIDTTCEDVKNIVIEFTGILNVTTIIAATSILTFNLFRICSDMRTSQLVSTANYFAADILGGVTTSHTLVFRFPFSDDDCKDCCSYVLELANIYNIDGGTLTYAINGILSALGLVSAG